MATPASAKKTKVSSCGLCDAKIAVKWKCKDCDKYLCENCKVQHQRNKATKKHVILEKKKGKPKTENKDSFPDLLNGNPTGTDSANGQEDIAYAFCTKHTDNLMQWFCNSCCLQVCKICISIEHEAHVIAEVASVLKKREKKITKYFKYVSENFLKDALERRKKSKELR
ncbi:hypothetical protein FSP39_008464 [Pinctada imbricata]|uniref:B box-type domain-containing protein n=1 Tax=Pinctada imbricata TaxID=66713 RepID=A0AA88YQL7_PINIB|nr:hypothetical protein FSP39_008464 [Pinctada imbricata]